MRRLEEADEGGSDGKRFLQVVRNIVGRRLTYSSLTGADLMPATT